MDSPLTSTMQTRCHGPELFPIVYCTLRPPYSGNLITDTEVMPNGQNQCKFPSKSGQSQLTGVKELRYIFKVLAISIHSMFQGLFALKKRYFQIRGIRRLERVVTLK